jgi:serine/threonine protein kinase
MSFCLNPVCNYLNPDGNNFCQRCRSKLLLSDRYRAVKLLAQGGSGKTYLGRDEDKPSQPLCVIKQFLPQDPDRPKAIALFREEVARLDELGKHPQIPALMASFQQEGYQFLIQEFIDGQSLETELSEQGIFTEDRILDLLDQMLPVLQFIHAGQIIHRDIKPENIIRRSQDRKLILVDLSAAKYAAYQSKIKAGTNIGSPEYMSPEQARGQAVFASDLYSLGATCLHLLTGMSPFDLLDSKNNWVWRDYLLGNRVSDRLAKILDKLVEFSCDRRYGSAIAVLQDLAPTPDPIKTPVTITTPPQPSPTLPKPIASSSAIPKLPTTLASAVGADYKSLQTSLAAGKWKDADEATRKIMLWVCCREQEGCLTVKHLERFPDTDLQTIDRLWTTASNGRFGFSVQQSIYRTGNYDFSDFAETVGWRGKAGWFGGLFAWKIYAQQLFTLDAPEGNMPIAPFLIVQPNQVLSSLSLLQCQIAFSSLIARFASGF